MARKICIFYVLITLFVASIHALPNLEVDQKIKCPQGSQDIMGDSKAAMPCYSFVPERMTYIEAKRACRAKNGFIPAINSYYKDIFITSSAHIFNQLYDQEYFWLGCDELETPGKISCQDGTDLQGYSNFDPAEPILSNGSCIVVSLSTGKWKRALCLDHYFFPCTYKAIQDGAVSTTTEPWESEDSPHGYRFNITIEIPAFENYTGLIWIAVVVVILVFTSIQCLCCLFFCCFNQMGCYNGGRLPRCSIGSYDYGRRRWGSYNRYDGYQDLEADDSPLARRYSPAPITTVENTVPPSYRPSFECQLSTRHTSPRISNARYDDMVQLHGHYSNYPSLPRSEVSAIFQERNGPAWIQPPRTPVFFENENGNILFALAAPRRVSPLPSPPPYNVIMGGGPSRSSRSGTARLELINEEEDPLVVPQLPPLARMISNDFRPMSFVDLSEEERIMKKQP